MNPQGLLGIALLLALSFVLSEDRRAIRWRTVLAGLALQIADFRHHRHLPQRGGGRVDLGNQPLYHFVK